MDDEAASPGERLLVFRVGASAIALPIAWVRGVREVVPGEEDRCRYAGRTLAVRDLAEVLGAGRGRGRGVHVVLGRGEVYEALKVEEASGFMDSGRVQGWPAWFSPLCKAYLRGVAHGAQGEVLVLDPDALLRECNGMA